MNRSFKLLEALNDIDESLLIKDLESKEKKHINKKWIYILPPAITFSIVLIFAIYTNNTIKSTVDNWYSNNLVDYTSYIEDTVYCNDRSISNLGGWEQDGGHTSTSLQFSPYTRKNSKTPTLTCSRNLDKFTVSSSNGNGALTYPIGLITADEAMYAGAADLIL